MANEPFDLDSFIDGLEQDAKRPAIDVKDRLNKVLMNTRENQGTVMLLPFISKSIGNVYFKIEGVREFNAPTSVIDREDPIWYRVLPIEHYGTLTPQQMELYSEVTGLWDELKESDELDYSEIRMRNYSFFTGVPIQMTNLDGKENKDFIFDAPCLLVYPSTNVIDAFNKAVTAKKTALKDKIKLFLQKIITPAQSGREGVIMITYSKADVGYDATISLETNNEYTTYVDPQVHFTDDFVKHFDDPIGAFVGWMYDNDNDSRFNELAFRELRDALKLRLKEISSEGTVVTEDAAPENKNGAVDPMMTQRPPVPGADAAAAPKAQRPW